MNADKREFLNSLSEIVIHCAFEVSNVLGAGFLEKVYENSLVHEIQLSGYKAEAQKRIDVHYKNKLVGEYVADILVEECLIVELKCVDSISDIHKAQVLNYLKATGLNLGLILNFHAPKVEIKRIVDKF